MKTFTILAFVFNSVLVAQSAIALFAFSDAAWTGFFLFGNVLVGACVTIILKRMEYHQKNRDTARDVAIDLVLKERDAAHAQTIKDSADKVDRMSENVTKIELNTNSMKDQLMAASKEASRLEGADAERKKALEIKAGITEAAAAAQSAMPTQGDVATNVSEVKETVGVIDENVKDVKGEVLKDVTAAVKQGVKEAKSTKHQKHK